MMRYRHVCRRPPLDLKGTDAPLLSLSELDAGTTATVVGVIGGHGILCRLAALGFTPGARVTVLRNPGRCAMIVSVLDTRIAIGRGEALKVRVRLENGDTGDR